MGEESLGRAIKRVGEGSLGGWGRSHWEGNIGIIGEELSSASLQPRLPNRWCKINKDALIQEGMVLKLSTFLAKHYCCSSQ